MHPRRKEPQLIGPYGGRLVDLLVPPEAAEELRARAAHLPSVQLSARAVCDLELLACGAFSPLDRFMGRADFECVLEEMRLAGGLLFPVPITLPVAGDAPIGLDQDVVLRDAQNNILAILTVEEVWAWDRHAMEAQVLGTHDDRHPMVAEMQGWGPLQVSGRLQVLQMPRHYDFTTLRLTPAQTRDRLEAIGRPNVVAFQTRNPLHRAHEAMTKRAMDQVDGTLLLHPVVGLTRPGDVDYFTRVRTYTAIAEQHYDPDRVLLALLPLAMRMAGPREAVWHAIIRRNYGANHLIVGRDHAGPGLDSVGRPFYGPLASQELLRRHTQELGVKPLAFGPLVYLPDEDRYEETSKLSKSRRTADISGTQVREQYLEQGRQLPSWFTRPEVATILAEAYPPRHQQGVCIWFTGLSGAGKSITAEILTVLLQEHGRHVTLLDGDVVRTHLSKGLGFSKEDRDTNIRRIGYVAAEIVRHGGVAVCAAISPYRSTRNDVRNAVGADRFVEVFVDTPIEVCEQRDTKGLYAKARRGELHDFTGVDDPYEAPLQPEVCIRTIETTPEENARSILDWLLTEGFVQGTVGEWRLMSVAHPEAVVSGPHF